MRQSLLFAICVALASGAACGDLARRAATDGAVELDGPALVDGTDGGGPFASGSDASKASDVPLRPNVRGEGESCDRVTTTAAMQSDCAMGFACLETGCTAMCVRLCEVDAECPASTCTREVPGGLKACAARATQCNPVVDLGPSGCAGLAQACFLSGMVKDRTVCECPIGAIGWDQPCTMSTQCLPGTACVDVTGANDFRCEKVCSLTGVVSGCKAAETCNPVNGSTKYGYCRI